MARSPQHPPACRRAWLALLAVGLGVEFQRATGVASLVAFATVHLLLIGAVLARSRPEGARVFLWTAAIAASCGWCALRIDEAPPDRLDVLAGPASWIDAPLVRIEGVIVSGARLSEMRGGRRCSNELAIRRIRTPDRWETASGRATLVRSLAPDKDGSTLPIGSVVRVSGRYMSSPPPSNPGERDWRAHGTQSGRVGRIDAGRAPIELFGASRHSIRSWMHRVRARAEGVIAGVGDERAESLCRALLLGDRDAAYREMDDGFARLGVLHLFAISGFHVGIVIFVVATLVRLTGYRPRLEAVVVCGAVAVMLLMIPLRAPIVRAGVAALALVGVDWLERRYDRLTILAWVGVGIIIWLPLEARSLGFQLTLGVTGALMWLSEDMRGRLFRIQLLGQRDVVRAGVGGWIARASVRVGASMRGAVTTSLLAWVVSAPVLVMRVGLVSPLAPLATLIATPVVFVMVVMGYAALVLGVAHPGVGGAMMERVAGVGTWMAAASVIGTDQGWTAARIGGASPALCVATLVWIVCWVRASRRDGRRVIVGGVVLVVWACIGAVHRDRGGWHWRIDTLAVHDGTCHVIRTGDRVVLWDCGSMSAETMSERVIHALRALGVDRIDTAVVSHANVDHFGCLERVSAVVPVDRVVIPVTFQQIAQADPSGIAAGALRAWRARGCRVLVVSAGDAWRVGECEVRVLSPRHDHTYRTPNDGSLVAVWSIPCNGSTSRVLFTGDIEREAMGMLMSGEWIEADVLELPHHGSAHEVAYRFVEAVSPEIVLQSTGWRRVGDARWDPHRVGRVWHVTATDGAAWVTIDRDGLIRSGSIRGR